MTTTCSPGPACDPARSMARPARPGVHTWAMAWVLAVAALAAPAGPAQAADTLQVEGQRVATQAQVAGQALVLNGVGLRAVAWLKGYVAALYLPRKATQAEAVLAMPGPKRLQLRMLQQVSTQEFVKAFDRGVKRNTPDADLPSLQARMQQFDTLVAALGQVRKGDVVDLDFVPGQGLLFSHNGQRRGEPIAGDDFYDALLRVFIGAKVSDAELRAGLLGGPVQ